MADSRDSLVSSALRLSFITIGLNGVVGSVALVVGVLAGSPATAAFALNALLDSSASVVLVWRFRRERSAPEAAEQFERRAQTFILVAMAVVAVYIALEATRALINTSHADESAVAVALASVSLLLLPWLGWRKLVVAAALRSQALRGDGVLTLAAAALATITLIALLVNSQLGWWWADPAAALLIATALGTEAARIAVRHRIG